jgi:hypothetical protein
VIAGMLFPDSAEKFAQTYSKDAMKNLNAIDSGIYDVINLSIHSGPELC